MANERVKRWTPGPWDRSRYHHPNRDVVQRTGGHDNDSRPGLRHVCAVATNVQQEANARLIAAAPDLVEALEDLLSGWKYIREQHGDLYGVGWDRAQDKAEVALALAYGETS